MPRLSVPSVVLALAVLAAVVAIGYRLRSRPTPEVTPPLAAPSAEEDSPPPTSLPGFEETARTAGLDFRMHFLPDEQGEFFKTNLYDHGCGVAVGDYDGDGRDDLYFANQLGANALYRNEGDGTFENTTVAVGPIELADRICVGAVFGDYDNDGDQDLYVASTRGGNVLFRNDDGRFVDATTEAGLSWIGHSQSAAFFDYDNDGRLDLFLTNTAAWTTNEFNEQYNYFVGVLDFPDMLRATKESNALFRNLGDGKFENATEAAGLAGLGWGGDIAAFDYDEDGRLDLLVTNMFGLSQLYRNGPDGRFQDVTADTLRRTTYGAIGAKAFDYNNDGRLDLFIADMHSDMWMRPNVSMPSLEPTKKYDTLLGPKSEREMLEGEQELMVDLLLAWEDRLVFGNTLHENRGDGRFEESSDAANLETLWPWGVATGDFDNDGHEDVFIPSGMGYPFKYWPNALMMNAGDGTFDDRAAVRGIEPPVNGVHLPEPIGGKPAARSSRCAAVADFDGDGRLEIVTNNFNDAPYYFRNVFPPQNYLAFRLTGTTSNRDAVGAIARCFVRDEILTRQVHAAGGYLSQSSKTLHFGLGKSERIDRVEIRWPSGQTQTIEAPELNRLHEVTEPQ